MTPPATVGASPSSAALGRLVERFRRQRPMRAGSLLVTIFGDAIAPRGGAATLASLIRLAEPFGVTERLVRTSVARLADDDWLVGTRAGRVSEYALSAAGRTRFALATRRIYGGAPAEWNGQWTVVTFPSLHGTARQSARDELRWAGFGEPSAGVFVHPHLSPAAARERLEALGLARAAVVLRSTADRREDDAALVAAGWDLAELGAGYRRFVRAFEPAAEALAAGHELAPEEAFVLRTLLVHDYRRIHLRDPLLPAALLPGDWVGSTAYALCREVYSRVFRPAEAHLGVTAARLDGPLPGPEPETWARFGGLPRR